MSDRAEYVRNAFKFNNTPSGWEALWLRPDGSTFASIKHVDRAEVRRLARAHWGHFNFADEAEAFNEIFH